MIVKKTGEFYIVEIKSEKEREDETVIAKEEAVKRLQQLQPEPRFDYEILTGTEVKDVNTVVTWIRSKKNARKVT